MSHSNGLVPFSNGRLPIASMRSVYRVGDVEKRLDKLPQRWRTFQIVGSDS